MWRMKCALATCLMLIGTAAAGCVTADQTATTGRTNELCTVTARLTPLPGLPEASGVALSRRTPGLLWSHNDSGQPLLFALDAMTGAVKGRVRVAGAEVGDWEDVSAGPCPQGSCLYIADIGDNNRLRRRITLYRVPEPRADQPMTQPAEAFEAAYPDGAHDAEALFVTADADLFVVTKSDAGSTAVYRFPKPLRPGSALPLQLVSSKLPVARITDADASPDGAWVAIRTYETVLFYRTQDLVSGTAVEPRRFDVRRLGEPQGEGVTITADGTVYLTGEGGGRGGTFASLRCALR